MDEQNSENTTKLQLNIVYPKNDKGQTVIPARGLSPEYKGGPFSVFVESYLDRFGFGGDDERNKRREQMLLEVEYWTKQVRTVARPKLKAYFGQKANNVGMRVLTESFNSQDFGRIVSTFEDFEQSWQMDDRDYNYRKVHQVLETSIQQDLMFMKTMVGEIMAEVGLVFEEDSEKELKQTNKLKGKAKGQPLKNCIEILVNAVRGDMIKSFKLKSKKMHGRIIENRARNGKRTNKSGVRHGLTDDMLQKNPVQATRAQQWAKYENRMLKKYKQRHYDGDETVRT